MGVQRRLGRVSRTEACRWTSLAAPGQVRLEYSAGGVVSDLLSIAGQGAELELVRFRSVEKLWTWPETLPVGESVKHGVDVAVTTYGMLPASFMFVSAFGCLRCTPLRSQTPSATPAIAEIEAKFPSVDWAKPGSGFPLALVSPVRREAWFQQGFRSKVIVDPWCVDQQSDGNLAGR